MTINGHRPPLDLAQQAQRNGFPPPEEQDGHTCPHCGGEIACEFKALTTLRFLARAITTLSNHREAQLVGVKWGRPRGSEFTMEQAAELLRQHRTIRGVAKALGVDYRTVKREFADNGFVVSGTTRQAKTLEPAKLPPGVTLTRREK